MVRDGLGKTSVRKKLTGGSMTGLAWGVLMGGVVLSAIPLITRWEPRPGSGDGARRSDGRLVRRATFEENTSIPIERPVIHLAADAAISPDELVVGVVVDGKARAYRLASLEGRTRHLVNDVIGGVPVSVAYCNWNGCARAYVGMPDTGPLKLRVTGLLDGAMVLESGDTLFFQTSDDLVDPVVLGSSHNPVAVAKAHRVARAVASRLPRSGLPFATLKSSIVTWKSWIAQHPGTDSYTGL
ncbi:MAG: DUF3179 domain-containing (seleno)protein [Isosphaeraceae bacterium]